MPRILVTGNTNDSHHLLSDVAVEHTGSDLLVVLTLEIVVLIPISRAAYRAYTESR